MGLGYRVRKLNPLRIMFKDVPKDFLSETINRPWMRMYCFMDEGPLNRTPECYKKFFYDWKIARPENPAHYEKKTKNWEENKYRQIVPAEETYIPLRLPKELHDGIWGGEAVVKGLQKRQKKRYMVPHYWMPKIKQTVVYSEILDKYMRVMVTERALNLIDEHFGLDNYILKSTPADLMSELALKLRREMYFVLLEQKTRPYEQTPDKHAQIYDKYKQHIVPYDVADWFGLNLGEAYKKQRAIEQEEAKLGPYKDIFRREYIDHLKAGKDGKLDDTDGLSSLAKIGGFLSKVNPFGEKKTK